MSAALSNTARLEVLYNLDCIDSGTVDQVETTLEIVKRALDAPVALVTLIDFDAQYFKAQRGLPLDLATAGCTTLDYSMCKFVVNSGKTLAVPDTRENPLTRESPAIADLGALAYLGAPIAVEGEIMGAICVVDHDPRQWSTSDIEMLENAAGICANALMADLLYRRGARQLKRA